MLSVSALLLVIISVASIVGGGPTCEPDNSEGKSSCMCKFNNGSKIDLRKISKKDGPRFSNIPQNDNPNTTYYYDPCYPFNTSDGCNNTLLCEKNINTKEVIPLGTTDVGFDSSEPNGKIYIIYGYIQPAAEGTTIRSKVQLICDNDALSPEFNFYSEEEEEELTYNFKLTSKCCCADGCNASATPTTKPSEQSKDPGIVGIILLSILVAVVLGYFIIGSIIMKVKYQATGTDIIPNKLFWMLLPFLVKDGVMFTVSPCMKICHNKGYTMVDD